MEFVLVCFENEIYSSLAASVIYLEISRENVFKGKFKCSFNFLHKLDFIVFLNGRCFTEKNELNLTGFVLLLLFVFLAANVY